METLITDLTIFENYKERQVVLNYYKDTEGLIKRDGFHFHSINVLTDSEELLFTKVDGSCCTIAIRNFADRYIDSQFPNYFVLRNRTGSMEIYFP